MGLHHRFFSAAARWPDRTALEVEGGPWSYGALDGLARRIATRLAAAGPPGSRTAIVGQRSAPSFAGVLAALAAGHSYVPVHPDYPPARALDMVRRAGCVALIVDPAGTPLAKRLVEQLPELAVVDGDPGGPALAELADPGPDAEANLLFTSGSTGRPKGVAVSHGNVDHAIAAMVARYAPEPDDRFSQLFELVFDLAGFDLFVPWSVGAALAVPTRAQLLLPGRYAVEARLTRWFSVPSTGTLALKQRALGSGAWSGLRTASFCGEALPDALCEAVAVAAPEAAIDNLYGPTEVALVCTAHRWTAPGEGEAGIAPIGRALPGLRARVARDDGSEVDAGEVGELWMAGPQVALGYLDPVQTMRAFVRADGDWWYRTGDRVRRPRTEDGPLLYLGRADSQVQVHGYRVELAEVEDAVRIEAGTPEIAVLPWPPGVGRCDALIAFVPASCGDPRALRTRLGARLPWYMVPREVRPLPALPRSTNGKIDRAALAALLGGHR